MRSEPTEFRAWLRHMGIRRVAAKAGLSKSTVASWAAGDARPSRAKLDRLLDVYGDRVPEVEVGQQGRPVTSTEVLSMRALMRHPGHDRASILARWAEVAAVHDAARPTSMAATPLALAAGDVARLGSELRAVVEYLRSRGLDDEADHIRDGLHSTSRDDIDRLLDEVLGPEAGLVDTGLTREDIEMGRSEFGRGRVG